jgi:hypothetical protein
MDRLRQQDLESAETTKTTEEEVAKDIKVA